MTAKSGQATVSDRLQCFKAYDIRGRVPDEIDEDIVYRIGRSYAEVIAPSGPVAVGRDMRLSSESLAAALIRGLNDSGVATRDLGLCGTELVYFAAAMPGMAGGVMVTASHNPANYNGLKLVREHAIPISGDSGLFEIESRVRNGKFGAAKRLASNQSLNVWEEYVDKVLSFVDVHAIQPLHIVVNAGNGCAGLAFDAIAQHLPLVVTRLQCQPDGTFPNGVPNPLLPENREATSRAVHESRADFGIAWDGDFDRCFFFNDRGNFIEGYYIVGLLTQTMLRRYPGARIVHDPRLTWNTIAQATTVGGTPVQSKTGHAFIKERMRHEDAVYGGEMSAHHYFRDFAYCDSGMIPWLLVAELVSVTGRPLAALVDDAIRAFPCSGEINFCVSDIPATLARIEKDYAKQALTVDHTDGLSVEHEDWRFNLRGSNTEPVLRLNVETRGDPDMLTERVACIERDIRRLA